MYCLGLLEVELETEVSADVDGVESGVAMAGTAKGDEIARSSWDVGTIVEPGVDTLLALNLEMLTISSTIYAR